jgi:hypothetical protein
MVADARVKTDPLYDLPGIEAMRSIVSIQLVEISHAHGQIGAGK